MPTPIFKDEVRDLLEEGTQLVEVLPRKELDRETTARLRRDAPVIVYCHDHQ